ncbi:Hypothetical predicted protein [Olea europaea subsp. europaea]|uniref:Uncharacterized protein n=1 Tax=Olea europaea subsp. europaea TaxID=158383 RepID=A0A8S0R4I8_OLEEU|nr:Hypothetical predicted protein [Olea europaea subsp. europaea]
MRAGLLCTTAEAAALTVDETVRVRKEARVVHKISQSGWGEGLWVVMDINKGILTRVGLLCTTAEATAPAVARAVLGNSQSWSGEGLWVVMAIGYRFLIEVKEYFRELGCFALRLRLLLWLWGEEPKNWMRGDLHVPNRASIPKSIDGTLVGKMRLQESEGKPGQFAKILKVGGEKGFGL